MNETKYEKIKEISCVITLVEMTNFISTDNLIRFEKSNKE